MKSFIKALLYHSARYSEHLSEINGLHKENRELKKQNTDLKNKNYQLENKTTELEIMVMLMGNLLEDTLTYEDEREFH